MSVYVKLMQVQVELKAPKSQYNSFGKYKYRSCEDIQEAVKPLETKYNVALFLSDEPTMTGERYYIKATATFVDLETGETVQNTGYAREEESKKGMDGSQVTGTASSYARKYALNGLFLIDDTKDADTDEYRAQQQKAQQGKKQQEQKPAYVKLEHGITYVRNNKGGYTAIDQLTIEQLEQLLTFPAFEPAHAAVKKLLAEVKHE